MAKPTVALSLGDFNRTTYSLKQIIKEICEKDCLDSCDAQAIKTAANAIQLLLDKKTF